MDSYIIIWHFCGLVFTLYFSQIVPMILQKFEINIKEIPYDKRKQSQLIGFCELILIYIFIAKGEITGLGFIFAAKALARNDDSKDENMQTYFLAGTLVNFTYAILMASYFKILENDFLHRVNSNI
jgi:hypothetical protein